METPQATTKEECGVGTESLTLAFAAEERIRKRQGHAQNDRKTDPISDHANLFPEGGLDTLAERMITVR